MFLIESVAIGLFAIKAYETYRSKKLGADFQYYNFYLRGFHLLLCWCFCMLPNLLNTKLDSVLVALNLALFTYAAYCMVYSYAYANNKSKDEWFIVTDSQLMPVERPKIWLGF